MSEVQRWSGPHGLSIQKKDGEILTEAQHLEAIYRRAQLDDVFERFAFGLPRSDEDQRITNEDDLYGAVGTYVVGMFPFIMNTSQEINVPFVRAAFDKVFDGMNRATSKKLGFEEPLGFTSAFLTTIGVKKPKPREHIAVLDDRYWNEQFMRQFSEFEGLPNEEPAIKTMKYIFSCMKGFAIAPFSYVQQADRTV